MHNYDLEFIKDDTSKLIAGVDEVGRGPLAGPVCVASCIMSFDNIIEGINDSKKLTEKKREILYHKIIENAISYNVVMLDNNVIDEINILNATKSAMKTSIKGLSTIPDIVLIDAVPLDMEYEVIPIIKGDTLSYNIACASIIAKVSRDKLMIEYSKEYPGYGFEKHKGYGTKLHYEAIDELGITPIHRKTFLKGRV